MLLRVRHVTSYAYGRPVDMATHMLHLTPRALPHQRVISHRLDSTPAPARITHGEDHFGNGVAWMFLDDPHARFEVVARAVVDVSFPAPPPVEATRPWEEVAALAPREPQAAEFTFDSPMVAASAVARDFAAPSFPPGRPILAGLLDLNARFRKEFRFRSGVTTIATPVEEVLRRREGVCQDYSHVMLAGLRSLGLPARYVSGYLRTYPPPGQTKRQGADMSHAWVGAWMGPGLGWIDLDPTNDLVVHEEHVVLGWGRDFGDVSPLRGVILGGGRHTLEVGVDLEPVEEE
ncbi:transglutaminase family protein [Roseomonas sp. OT10]|uniref:transglutaminase family protein n=1 Tax=Roseomonas cutis TaxID=2897332 RepID=UPI001E4E435E|nr:transglutaminase family protein [Roseomonas sp. OT10]UFN51127.1 transglutaminase family protein [Roseomonas sp. OT10]